jgi:hypothetical protein
MCKSQVKLFGRKTKKYLLGENYEITFKLKNVGEKEFPSGRAKVWIDYTSGQRHFMEFFIPKIEKEGELLIEKIDGKISKSALGKGYALFFCGITASDDSPVKVIKYGQDLPENASFGAIFIETRTDIYSYYALMISAVSLVAMVILSILSLIFR